MIPSSCCFSRFVLMTFLSFKARDVKIVRPLYGVELFDGETARFEVEISEDDVHGQWTLNGDVLSRSPVRLDFCSPLGDPAPLF